MVGCRGVGGYGEQLPVLTSSRVLGLVKEENRAGTFFFFFLFLLRVVQDLRILRVVLRTSKGKSLPRERKDLLAIKKRIFPYFLFNLLLYYDVEVCYF